MEMPADVLCMAVAPVPSGLLRSRFLALGCEDNTVRIVSLDPKDCLQPLGMQALPAKPSSLCLLSMASEGSEHETIYLHIGLENGVYLRTVLDSGSGEMSDTRTRYLGSRAVNLVQITLRGTGAVLALSSRPWLAYSYQVSQVFCFFVFLGEVACFFCFVFFWGGEGSVVGARQLILPLHLARRGTPA
jgi:splicing factor 3B subunit 3